ncbi:hypothetical protein [Saprospira grandis]|uniref:hypothetical protein n=1 Tax=Saprospira grandis TaxID=1008 RepID=UPI0022DDD402|nr:hypothetical protein [Saprospira grandis]WBM75723.1 hypothetical protein OP864_05650 [Saprospira grandis]
MLVKCKINSQKQLAQSSSSAWIKKHFKDLYPYGIDLELHHNYVVHAIQYYQIPFVYIYTSYVNFPRPYPLEFFEVVDARLSKYFCFGEIQGCPISSSLDPFISFKEWAENPDFFSDLVEGEDYTKVAQNYKEKLEVEFFNPNLNISEESAIILDPKMSWLFCPACTESWEVQTADEMTVCPSCELYYHNPFIKNAGEES